MRLRLAQSPRNCSFNTSRVMTVLNPMQRVDGNFEGKRSVSGPNSRLQIVAGRMRQSRVDWPFTWVSPEER